MGVLFEGSWGLASRAISNKMISTLEPPSIAFVAHRVYRFYVRYFL